MKGLTMFLFLLVGALLLPESTYTTAQQPNCFSYCQGPIQTRSSAFSAVRSNPFTPSSFWQPLPFERVHTNVGDDFNTTTGRFTCEIPGLYLFTYSIMTDTDSPTVHLMKNDVLINGVYRDDEDLADMMSNTAVLQLAAGDRVTGGNKGIGFAIARALCKQLNNGMIYLTARNEERGKAAVEELEKENLNPRFHQLDINDNDSITRLRDHLLKEHGGLDILVNNAGIGFTDEDPSPISIQAPTHVATNFDAQLHVCHALFPVIRSNGRVCNVASGSGVSAYFKLTDNLKNIFKNASNEEDVMQLMQEYVGAAKDGSLKAKGWIDETGEMSYGISKLGFIALTKIQAEDIQVDKSREGILINCCCPGYTATDLTNHEGHQTTDEGAKTPVHLALLPSGVKEPQGKFIQKMKVKDFWFMSQDSSDSDSD